MTRKSDNCPDSQKEYLFYSARLGFRNWIPNDIEKMSAISADPEVMRFFPTVATHEQTNTFIEKMQSMFSEEGFCYFAVDKLEDSEFIGFIGLMKQTYEADFTPCVDIGWRLKRSEWNNGYATEGAVRCLKFAFEDLKLDAVYATAPEINLPSQNVMIKANMQKQGTFIHPRLKDNERLRRCVIYSIRNYCP